MRSFAAGSEFIPAEDISKYNPKRLEQIRHGCEKALWFAILTHPNLFGKDTLPNTMQAHIYNGLCILRDVHVFMDDCIRIREEIWVASDATRSSSTMPSNRDNLLFPSR